jgi:uncharacterized protein (TIGR00288 family)
MIDFDNVTMGIRSDLQNQLRKLLNSEIIKGNVAVQRAYADWRRYPQYIVPLSEASIDLIFAPAFGSNKKNATDIRLAIDALELVFTRPEIGTFILLSGDSDFSSLVLKLKEYGKYIIGVGLRESSSDLLIQNCDEYYGYTELTGLTREGEVQAVRRDPWELVVEAVTTMKRDDDVMRSDRLKQVMQTLDPNFNEKDAGFSRFSRFVVEASQRGLLRLEKMENGQYAVDLGDNANVPPEEEAEIRRRDTAQKEGTPKSRRKRTSRRREGTEQPRQLTLAEAFDLLNQSLLVLGAAGDASTTPDEARDKMIDLLGDETDSIFQRPRFHRLLRQAHDADLIELAKAGGDAYELKLRPQAVVEKETEATSAATKAHPAAQMEDEAPAAEKQPRSRKSTTKKTSKSRSRTAKRRTASAEQPAAEASSGPSEVGPKPSDEKSKSEAQTAPKRHPRFRRGSRGAPSAPGRSAADKASDEATATAESSGRDAEKGSKPAARSVRPRGGGRRARGAPRSDGDAPSKDKAAEASPDQLADTNRGAGAATPPADDVPLARGSLRGADSGEGDVPAQDDGGDTEGGAGTRDL